MLQTLALQSFKRFRRLDVQLAPLTILTGLNGSGKSTIIQSVLLAHQASRTGGLTVALTAPGLDLGQAMDVLNVDAEDTRIEVHLGDDDQHTWVFGAGGSGDNDAPYLEVVERPSSPPAPIGSEGSRFTYLGAERLGPRTSHPTAPSTPDEAVIGEDGRYVAHALAICSRREIDSKRRHPAAGTVTTLGPQTEAWLSEMVGPTQLDASLVPRTSLALLRIRNPGRMGEWMLPTNTGFGVSYALPVIVGGLLAPPGGLLIVDSPEAHLHPAAQSALGGFLAAVAASGVQTIIETHSDHVLNGVRKAVAVNSKISPEEVRFLFFGISGEPASMSLSRRGTLSDWPSGFFDQFEADLGALTRVSR